MTSKITAWSPSRLSTYEQCPKRAYFEYIRKLKSPQGQAAAEGSRVHELAAKYLEHTLRELPPELEPFGKEFRALRASELKLHCEQQYAFTSTMQSTDWFAKDAWLRVIFDLVYFDLDKQLIVTDYKTGKVRDKDLEQLELYACVAFVLWPTIKRVTTRLWYLKPGIGEQHEVIYSREEAQHYWNKWVARATDMLEAEKFPARRSPLCRWCPYTTKHAQEVDERYTREGVDFRSLRVCEEG